MRLLDALDRALLAGVSFGAGLALGLLLAPEAGDLTRRRIARRARTAADAARAQAHDLADPMAERVRETGRHLTERHVPLAGDVDLIDAEAILDDLRHGRP